MDITGYMRRVTTPGSATVTLMNGERVTEAFPLGRVVDSRRYDVAALTKAGIATVALVS